MEKRLILKIISRNIQHGNALGNARQQRFQKKIINLLIKRLSKFKKTMVVIGNLIVAITAQTTIEVLPAILH